MRARSPRGRTIELRPTDDRSPLEAAVVGDIERLGSGGDLLDIDVVSSFGDDRDNSTIVSGGERAHGKHLPLFQRLRRESIIPTSPAAATLAAADRCRHRSGGPAPFTAGCS